MSFADSSVRPTFSATIGIAPLARFLERAHEALRIARRLHEQSDDASARLIEREIEVLVHRDGELLAGRDDEVEIDALVASTMPHMPEPEWLM